MFFSAFITKGTRFASTSVTFRMAPLPADRPITPPVDTLVVRKMGSGEMRERASRVPVMMSNMYTKPILVITYDRQRFSSISIDTGKSFAASAGKANSTGLILKPPGLPTSMA